MLNFGKLMDLLKINLFYSFYLTFFSQSPIYFLAPDSLLEMEILLKLTSEFNEVAKGDLGGETCKVLEPLNLLLVSPKD